MKIYFNGWFSGFIEKTNPGLHVDFFLNLFEKVYPKGMPPRPESKSLGSLNNFFKNLPVTA